MATISLFWHTSMAAVTSCENSQFAVLWVGAHFLIGNDLTEFPLISTGPLGVKFKSVSVCYEGFV